MPTITPPSAKPPVCLPLRAIGGRFVCGPDGDCTLTSAEGKGAKAHGRKGKRRGQHVHGVRADARCGPARPPASAWRRMAR